MMGLNVGSVIATLRMDSSQFNAAINIAQQRMNNFAKSMQRIGSYLTIGLTAPLVLYGKKAVKAFADFDDAIVRAAAVTKNMNVQMRLEMEKTAKMLSRTSLFSPVQIAQGYFALGQAGYDAAQQMKAMPVVLDFATASSTDLDTAIRYLSRTVQGLGMYSEDPIKNMEAMKEVADAFTFASITTTAEIEDFAIAMTHAAAPALKLVNKSMEEGTAALMAFALAGIQAEEAGTLLWTTVRDLQRASLKARKEWKKFGIDIFDSNRNMKNLADIFGDLEGKLAGMSDETKKAALMMLGFQDRSLRGIQALMGFSEEIRTFEHAMRTIDNLTEKVADTYKKSFKAQMIMAKNTIISLGISIGEYLAPILININEKIKQLADWWGRLSDNGKLVVVEIGLIALAFGPLLIVTAKAIQLFAALVAVMMALNAVTLASSLLGMVRFLGAFVGLFAPIKSLTFIFKGLLLPIKLVKLSLLTLLYPLKFIVSEFLTLTGLSAVFTLLSNKVTAGVGHITSAVLKLVGAFGLGQVSILGFLSIIALIAAAAYTVRAVWNQATGNIKENLVLLADTFRLLFDYIANSVVGKVVGFIYNSFVSMFTNLRQNLREFAENTVGIFGGIGGAVKNIFGKGSVAEGFAKGFTNTIEKFDKGVTDLSNKIKTTIGLDDLPWDTIYASLKNATVENLAELGDSLKKQFGEDVSFVTDLITSKIKIMNESFLQFLPDKDIKEVIAAMESIRKKTVELGNAVDVPLTKWQQFLSDAEDISERFIDNTMNAFDSLATTLTDFISGAEVDWKQFTGNILKMYLESLIKMQMAQATAALFDQKTGIIKSVIGALFNSGASTTASGATGNSSALGVGQVNETTGMGWALGGAFRAGKVIPMALGGLLNSVVNSPTLAPMSSGRTALMGEAGPEGVLPLKRDSSGRLGVHATTPKVNVENKLKIINVETEEQYVAALNSDAGEKVIMNKLRKFGVIR